LLLPDDLLRVNSEGDSGQRRQHVSAIRPEKLDPGHDGCSFLMTYWDWIPNAIAVNAENTYRPQERTTVNLIME
jgi:hypothetical protein